MVIPSRFIKPAARSRRKAPTFNINPTVIGVLLSVGAHALLIMFAPRANFSFAALSEAAQQQDAEETIVPVVELTPAERNRLPSFAQPRRSPPAPTGLSSLALPPGLPRVSSPVPVPRTRSRPQQSTLPRTTTRRLPSPTAQPNIRQTVRPRLPQTVRRPSFSFDPSRVTNRAASRPSTSVEFYSPETPAPAPPTVGPDGLPILEGQTPLNPEEIGSIASGSAADLVQPNGQSTGRSIEDLLASQNAPNASSGNENSSEETAAVVEDNNEQTDIIAAGGTEIAVETEAVNPAPAQGDPRQLLAGYSYDATDVDEAAAEENKQEWLVASAENKSGVETETTTLEIDSQFKVCKENPPTSGLVGVVVNPDGSQENAQVLKSTGYDVLNRQALSAVEYYSFEQPSQPTQYLVDIGVIYEPEGCVDALPEDVLEAQ